MKEPNSKCFNSARFSTLPSTMENQRKSIESDIARQSQQYFMNFIIKNVLKKIFTQYLYIEDEGLDLTSGIIKLPLGTINQTRINEKLEPFGVRITSSLYKNLIIHLPIVELTSKPIRISIEVFDVVIERVYKQEDTSQRKESWSSVESNIENTPERESPKDVIDQQKQGGYFRNIINRLLYNMQICMEKINIRLIDTRQEQQFREAYFTLHSFKLKNSLVILEANIVKKTLTMDELHLRHAVGQVIVKDLSLCLDFSNKKLHVIVVGGSIRLDVFKIPFSIIMKGLNKKKPARPKQLTKKSLLQETSLFLKLNSIQVCFKLIETVFNSIEVRSKANSLGSEINVNFKSIKCMNMGRQKQELCLVQLGYLPFNQFVKINSEYQDSAIKQTWIHFKNISNASDKLETMIKVYHLSINVNVDEWKQLVNKLLLKEREIEKMKTIVAKIKENDAAEPQAIVQDQNKNYIDALIYRVSIMVNYGPSKLEIFGSSLIQIRQQQNFNQNSPKNQHNRQFIRDKEDQQGLQVTLIKVYQLGVRAFNCNILQISDLHAKITEKQVIVNGNSMVSQLALSCHDKVIDQASIVQRDIAYYQEKIKKYLPNKQVQILQIEINEANLSKIDKEFQLNKKIFLKFDETIISIGQSVRNPVLPPPVRSINTLRQDQQQVKFISIIDIELSKLLLSFISSKIKLNVEAIIFISSPYTLERTPLTNELQVEVNFGIPNNELCVSFKNKLVFLIQDHYINIIYKLLDKQDVWCSIVNLTHQNLVLVQETNDLTTIFSEKLERKEKIGLSDSQVYNYSTIINPNSTKNVFWIGDDKFRISMGSRQSQIISVKMTSPQASTKNARLCYESIKELVFSEDKDYDYILRLQYNKLGNLCQIIVDYKILITSYSSNFIFKIGTHSFEVHKSKRERWEWFLQLQDLSEDFEHYQVISEYKRTLKIQQLMAHQQFNIMGIYENVMISEAPLMNKKLYHGYIYQNKTGYQLKYTIMPLLIITNNCFQQFQLEITDKKTQEKQIVTLKDHQSIQLNLNEHFDYYLRQFTIKISVVHKQQITFESQSLYFNTFFMVDHKTQTNVLLRSTQKNNYSKKSLIFQQSLLLKTKVITLKSSLHINNSTDFHFTCQAKQALKSYTAKIDINAYTTSQWTHRIKEDSIIQFLINKNIENKVEIRYGELKEMKLLSFNFCKIQDRFFNVFIRVQRRIIDGIETIFLDHFIEIINLCNYIDPVSLHDFPAFEQGVRTNLPLNSTSLNKYNNKPIELDDIAKIYAQIFLTAKVTDLPLSFILGQQLIKFQLFLKQSTQQLQIQRNKFVVTLLKDMNNNKITFYLTDRLFNQKLHYTIFNNETKSHFLLTDDFEYAPHFSNIVENCSNVPQKVLIGQNSFNCLMNRQNYDLLLCDRYETHLQKIDKKVLEKQGIKLQQYNFDTLTLFDCTAEQQKSERKQFTTKQVQIRIRMYDKVQLSISLHALTLRLLQTGKLDCLIQDISIKNQQTKDHLLRIPQQTYLLFEGRLLHQGYFLLIKNLFVKCKNVIVNMKRQMPYSLIELMATLSERLGLNIDQSEISQQTDPRRYRQTIKKLQGQTKLKNHIKEALLLIRNLYIHEIHLSLTIELENLSFSNVIILPFYEIQGKFQRSKSFMDGLANFYLTTLLAKFPKLSFLMSNFRSPLNTIRLFFNLREALKIKVENQPIIHFGHADFSSNPFHFSKQRWNIIHNQIVGQGIQQVNLHEQIVSYLFQGKKCMILTNLKIYWLDQKWINWNLRDLQSLKINRNRVSSQLILKFRGNHQLVLLQQHKRCVKMLNNIEKLLL